MNGIFYSIKADDLLSSQNRRLAEKVAGIWDDCVGPESDYHGRQEVILVDFGHWLHQSAWHDETGFFLKFRLHPLDKHRDGVKEKGRKVLKAFMNLFPGNNNTTTYNEEVLHEGTEETVTVVVKTGKNTVGD